MVPGFVSKYKWLLKLLKAQIIIAIICETAYKEHQSQTGFLPSLFRLCTFYESFQEYASFFSLLKKTYPGNPNRLTLEKGHKDD